MRTHEFIVVYDKIPTIETRVIKMIQEAYLSMIREFPYHKNRARFESLIKRCDTELKQRALVDAI